jgi:hypothetical protein
LRENFDRFNFALYKEKEMVAFRRCITALAVLALFAGLASAQIVGGGGAGAFACSTQNVTVTPQLRSEGFTEEQGDIVLSCTGGANIAVGNQIPFANITVYLNTQVTSRLLGTGGVTNASEALLLIDEPGSGLPSGTPGFGPEAPQLVCPTPNSGCTEVVGPNGQAVNAVGGTTPGYNVFQGVVSGNSVTFFGVPILPPVSTGILRVFRITNVRVNATALAGGAAAGPGQVVSSVSISSSTSVPITNPTLTTGFVTRGLTTSVRNANNTGGGSAPANFPQCTSNTNAFVNILRFTELFGTAFKTRVAATATTGPTSGTPVQNVPGRIWNSESNFVLPVGSSISAGLADYGTRLKAVFNNIPTGVRLFVSLNNVTNTTLGQVPAQPNTSTVSYAALVPGETLSDTNGFFPVVKTSTIGATDVFEITPTVGNTATAVWEVLNTNSATNESLDFSVYTTYVANTSNNLPSPGQITVNMSYAPTPPAFTAAAAAVASSSLPIPRFADTSTASNFLQVNVCRTNLLFPYVTNLSGFDTGLAIANTSQDPFGTATQQGTCTLNFYGASAPTAYTTTTAVAPGTVWTDLASIRSPNFQGYIIAVCNFQYAHGFAFISDIGARNLAMGYLAEIIPDPARAANPFPAAGNGSGEQLGH